MKQQEVQMTRESILKNAEDDEETKREFTRLWSEMMDFMKIQK